MLLVLYSVVLVMLLLAPNQDTMIKPAKPPSAINPAPTATKCRSSYPCFIPAGYSIDVVIPIIKVGQTENWRINKNTPWGTAYMFGSWFATGWGRVRAVVRPAGGAGGRR